MSNLSKTSIPNTSTPPSGFVMPKVSVQELLESGVHFGHQISRWNPKMAPWIYKVHNRVHIINLPQTLVYLKRALEFLFTVAREGGRVLFVGTKMQAKDAIQSAAMRCGQYYVNHRWLGGMLTNWKTVSQSIKRLKELEARVASPEFALYSKKEQLDFHRKLEKLNLSLGGIRDMGDLPDVVFVLDTNKELCAVQEAKHLGIPIIAILDTNSNPDGIGYPIPGNDDASKAIRLYCDLMAQTILEGLQAELQKSGKDLGAQKDVLSAESMIADFAEKNPEKSLQSNPSAGSSTPSQPSHPVSPASL